LRVGQTARRQLQESTGRRHTVGKILEANR
jgi:hypothetical protein